MKNNLIILLIIILFQSCSTAPKPDAPTDKIKQVETSLINPVYIVGDSTWSIEERMEHYGVPGVSLAVIYDDKIDWVKTYGVMDKESKSPVTRKTLFQAGSISKPVAAYGALRLVEQNQVDLNEDINTYLVSWKIPDSEFTKEKKVTLKNILNHSGGITVHGFLGYSPDLPVPSLVEVLNGEPPANSRAIFNNKTPEESFRYSGGGYTIMQQMMIDVEGMTFPKIMKKLVLQPLEMNNSTYDQPLQSEQLKMAATGYLPNGAMTKGKRHTYPEMAAAGLWTTAEDLAKFAVNIQQTLKGKNNIALSQEMTTLMLTPFVEDFTGLGIFLNKHKEQIYFGHGGWDEGFSSELIAHKDKGYGVVVLTNSNHPDFIKELIRSVALTYEWADFVPTYEKKQMDDAALNDYYGRYFINNASVMEVYQSDGLLYSEVTGEEAKELIKVTDTTYIRRENERLLQFKPDSENDEMNILYINASDGEVISRISKMSDDKKIPLELLLEGNFDQALEAYKELVVRDGMDPAVREGNLNWTGYQFLNEGKLKLAQDLFKINTILYPYSSNTYDSYAEACMKIGDTDLAIENYKKALDLDPKNSNAQEMILKLQLTKGI